MKLAVLGATGSVGREFVTQALTAGHEVTALVRNPPNRGEIDERVALVVGDAMNVDAVYGAVDGNDAVVSALGHVKGAPDDLLACTSANLITAMRADGVHRLVVLSSPAVDDLEDRPGLIYRAGRVLLGVAIPSVVRDHRDQARLLEESGLDWTLVRGPLVFTDGPHTGRYHAGPITRESGARISRADLADFMLTTATNGDFVRMTPLISSKAIAMLPLSDGLRPRRFRS
jgi:putative NADH-flavin reductase